MSLFSSNVRIAFSYFCLLLPGIHPTLLLYGLKDVITKLLISTSCQAGLEKSTSFSNFLFLGFLSPFLCVNLMDYLISLLELFTYRIFILFPF